MRLLQLDVVGVWVIWTSRLLGGQSTRMMMRLLAKRQRPKLRSLLLCCSSLAQVPACTEATSGFHLLNTIHSPLPERYNCALYT
jgi:hypothetical protein